MFLREHFSKRVVELRKQKRINQETLGEIAGIKKSAVSLMERGLRGASIEVIVILADYFDVSVDYLIGRSDDPKRH
ncbi:MAG: helix-turn-helix domain-containing protein [Oscillospiraceae bacterium]|nr:helix-turn-helix domain-containing protein [Oscillospiraceae bacterium]